MGCGIENGICPPAHDENRETLYRLCCLRVDPISRTLQHVSTFSVKSCPNWRRCAI